MSSGIVFVLVFIMKTFKDLIVWQKSVSIVYITYRCTRFFPREELFGLTSQIRRCAVSIPSNIAEGYGRRSTKDYVRFLNISMGSLYELLTLLEVSYNLKFIDQKAYNEIIKLTAEVGKMLNTLITKIQHSNRQNTNL